MAALAAILDESGSWISLRHNCRPNQVNCTWFHVCISCGSGGVAITRNSTWPPGGHIGFIYWPKKCINFIITISVTQLLDMKWFPLLAIWIPGLNITYYWFQKPISKWPPWQPSWMSQGNDFQLSTTTGPTNYIALGFVSASYVGLEE